jgi:isoleucyl-tRNA synthetase
MLWHNLAVKGGLPGAPNSVHLSDWPAPDPQRRAPELARLMTQARQVVEAGHAARDEAHLKVRQPLAGAVVGLPGGASWPEEVVALVRDELNLKSLQLHGGEAFKVELDTEITPELREEGLVRDLVRQLNEVRKHAGLRVEDRIILWLGSQELRSVLPRWEALIKREVLARELHLEPPAHAEGAHREVVKVAGEEIEVWLRSADAE